MATARPIGHRPSASPNGIEATAIRHISNAFRDPDDALSESKSTCWQHISASSEGRAAEWQGIRRPLFPRCRRIEGIGGQAEDRPWQWIRTS